MRKFTRSATIVLSAAAAAALFASAASALGAPPCPGDFNADGAISVQDLFDFFAAYFGGAPHADVNGSGVLSVQDIFDFLAAYFSGCP